MIEKYSTRIEWKARALEWRLGEPIREVWQGTCRQYCTYLMLPLVGPPVCCISVPLKANYQFLTLGCNVGSGRVVAALTMHARRCAV